jgi:alpha-beta hydrolase superfamily lysophospholipase
MSSKTIGFVNSLHFFMMKIVFFLVILVISILFSLFTYTWYRLHLKVNLHSRKSDRKSPADWEVETEFATNSDNQKIAYWYFPVDKSKAVVILIHGYSNPGGKPQMIGHTEYLHEAGYSTVLLDLRAFGESEGNKMTLGVNEWRDVEAVFDQIKSLSENKDKKVGFLGISMGAVISLMTAGVTNKGDFIIASVPYADFRSMFHSQIQATGLPPSVFFPFMKAAAIIEFGKDYQQFTPSNVIKNIKAPILLIAAKQDEELNSQDVKTLYDLANEPKEYWEIDSRHDIFDAYPKEFKERVLLFLQKYTR